ncbi:hypothetical protein LCGC14_0597450 [marine sediment metagenome]|uniref:HAD family hydrolase n=1 Tax=marine sediment metagenome TaxID=412755 RepID=A0A0F9UK16_9ZZZZ|nr:MAG: Pyrophosphatase PpaX [Candidatus Lokiarchaeum sp. GC14_75]
MNKLSFKGKNIIVFDLDGTIVRLSVDWMSLKEKLYNDYKKIYSENCSFESISTCLSKLVEKGDEEVLGNFFEIIRQYELVNIYDNQPIKETIFFINNLEIFGLDKSVKLAILSLNTRKTIVTSLKLANISYKFDYIIGREDVRNWKPDPEGLLRIQDFYKVKKEEMIYFGDLKKDILTGKSAGIDVFLIEDLINFVNKKKENLEFKNTT